MNITKYLREHNTQDIKELIPFLIPKNKLLGIECKELKHLPFETVYNIKELITNGEDIEAIILYLYNCQTKNKKSINTIKRKLYKTNYKEYLYFCKYLTEQVADIHKMDLQLQEDSTPDLENAGVDELDKFGYLGYIKFFAGKDDNNAYFLNKAYQFLKNKSYLTVYINMRYAKEKQSIQKTYDKIQQDKYKIH